MKSFLISFALTGVVCFVASNHWRTKTETSKTAKLVCVAIAPQALHLIVIGIGPGVASELKNRPRAP